MEVRRIDVDVWEMCMVQRPAEKSYHLLIEALADATHLRFGDAAVAAQGHRQVIDCTGGDAAGVGLHHQGVKGLVDPAAGLKAVGKEATLPQLWIARVRSPSWVVTSRLRYPLRWVKR